MRGEWRKRRAAGLRAVRRARSRAAGPGAAPRARGRERRGAAAATTRADSDVSTSATSKWTVGVASSPSRRRSGTISPCEPPETEGTASRKSQTSQARSQVLTATKTRRSRTTPPESTPATSAAAAPASAAGSSGQPSRAQQGRGEGADRQERALPSDGSPAGPTVSRGRRRERKVDGVARESSRTPGSDRNGTAASEDKDGERIQPTATPASACFADRAPELAGAVSSSRSLPLLQRLGEGRARSAAARTRAAAPRGTRVRAATAEVHVRDRRLDDTEHEAGRERVSGGPKRTASAATSPFSPSSVPVFAFTASPGAAAIAAIIASAPTRPKASATSSSTGTPDDARALGVVGDRPQRATEAASARGAPPIPARAPARARSRRRSAPAPARPRCARTPSHRHRETAADPGRRNSSAGRWRRSPRGSRTRRPRSRRPSRSSIHGEVRLDEADVGRYAGGDADASPRSAREEARLVRAGLRHGRRPREHEQGREDPEPDEVAEREVDDPCQPVHSECPAAKSP